MSGDEHDPGGHVPAAAARPFLGTAGFKLIAVAAVVSAAGSINAAPPSSPT